MFFNRMICLVYTAIIAVCLLLSLASQAQFSQADSLHLRQLCNANPPQCDRYIRREKQRKLKFQQWCQQQPDACNAAKVIHQRSEGYCAEDPRRCAELKTRYTLTLDLCRQDPVGCRQRRGELLRQAHACIQDPKQCPSKQLSDASTTVTQAQDQAEREEEKR